MVNEEKSTEISCKAVVGSGYCLASASYSVIYSVYLKHSSFPFAGQSSLHASVKIERIQFSACEI